MSSSPAAALAFVGETVCFLAFLGVAIVLPGLAVLRALRVPAEAALVLPAGLVVCGAAALASLATGSGALFTVIVLATGTALLVATFGVRPSLARMPRPPREAVAPIAILAAILFATRWTANRVLPTGDFVLDSFNWKDVAFHVGLIRELTFAFPPEVPGLAGLPLAYHFGLDLVRGAALRFAGVQPYDILTRFDPLLWAAALVVGLRAATALLGGGRAALAAVGFTFLAADFSFLWALSPAPHYWIDRLWGNVFLAVVDANSLVPALALFLAVVIALGRRLSGGGPGYVVLATVLAVALPFFKVFVAAHLALGLAVALLRVAERRAVLPPLLGVGCVLLAIFVAEGPGRVAVRLDPLVILGPMPSWLSPVPGAPGLWLVLWAAASLGLRLLGLSRAVTALRSRRAVAVVLGSVALSGWPLGLLFNVSARGRLASEQLFNEAGYFVVQSGVLLWIFAALSLAELARRFGPGIWVVAAALVFPATAQFVVHHATLPQLVIPGAVLDGMKALERDSRPGAVVLQRPHPRWPPPPVVFAGRRVPLTRIYPYLSQFATPAEIADRQTRLKSFFAASDPATAFLVARHFGATHVVAYEDDVLGAGALAIVRPIYEDPAVRVYRIRY